MWTAIDSPIGELRVVADDEAIVAIDFSPFDRGPGRDDNNPLLRRAADQLTEYFAGRRTTFDLPLSPRGTDFQRRVWAELLKIDHGQTATYGQIAHRLGMTNAASRAVGAANGANPIPVVIPCHRVIGANGKLTGYAGGLDRKRALLDLERPAPTQPSLPDTELPPWAR
ncbi:MAG TPA: methylated-DNA--[protein]-cysteine S-methyltransferase [Ilumatobacteraceae bacterium]|nr:methylated-DNA--[protein]-cysteine S-methyltransferase [Ilumatobacteraceae bacterium]